MKDKSLFVYIICLFFIMMSSVVFSEYNESQTSIEMAKLGYVQNKDKIWIKNKN